MNKLDLGQTITILANIGVIAGIIFLAIELRQNNALIETQNLYIQYESRSEAVEFVLSDPALAAAVAKTKANQELTDVEWIQLEAFNYRTLLGIRRNYREWRRGVLPPLTAEGMRFRFFVGGPTFVPLIETWDRYKNQMDRDFVTWIEANVIGPGPP